MGGPTDTHFDESAQRTRDWFMHGDIDDPSTAAAQNADQQDFSLIYCMPACL